MEPVLGIQRLQQFYPIQLSEAPFLTTPLCAPEERGGLRGMQADVGLQKEHLEGFPALCSLYGGWGGIRGASAFLRERTQKATVLGHPDKFFSANPESPC